jgi:hypothetical protein
MSELHLPHAHDETSHVHHEESDVEIRGILGFGAGLIVAAVLISFAMWVLFKYFDAREAHRVVPLYPLAAAQENRVPPDPRLQTNPREDMNELRAREDEILTSYGWVDRNAGIVRIPIEEAMKMTVERGLPVRQGGRR